MTDAFGREITYLRLSVTDLCNLRCAYCMPEQGVTKLCHSDILSLEEMEEIVRAAAACGIGKVRVTGGEPLVRRGIVGLCRRIAAVEGVRELCMTTNGILLPQYAGELRRAGVQRLNISLDTLDDGQYRKITRTGCLKDALSGLDAALEAGFERIKLNTVLIRGVNDGEIPELVALTRKKAIHIRFIELMPVGECAGWSGERFVDCGAVLRAVPGLRECGSEGVAKLYRLPGCPGTVGLISPISSHFCPSCNRIRVTADGRLKPCLHAAEEIRLRGLHGRELEDAIRNAILSKPQRHFLYGGAPSACLRNMNAVGG